MLFHSQLFLLLFLPLTLAGYYLAAGRPDARRWLLIAASLVFYGYWDLRFVPLLLGSVTGNWLLARCYRQHQKKRFIALGILVNLLIIGAFKYANFIVGSAAEAADAAFTPWDIVLPLGISFFTFQQISYLVDLHRGQAPLYSFSSYLLYVCFFPQLIAGPIVRHNEIIGQFALPPLRDGLYERLSRGAALFTLGLMKKVWFADRLAETATPLFEAAARGDTLTFAEAWIATGAYSMQLYFDFSGYSDMAVGLGLLFGFVLPINFDAPYRAVSIRDFWRRWHITLSRFLRDYLYVPLGGNRHGTARMLAALAITMVLGGLWHGAGWTFVVWGGLHGIALMINHLWTRAGIELPTPTSWLLTATFVAFAWVVFRADSLQTAWAIHLAMLAVGDASLAIRAAAHPEFVLTAALFALLGPTSQRVAFHWLWPRTGYALGFALASIALIFHTGDEFYSEFIYFQF